MVYSNVAENEIARSNWYLAKAALIESLECLGPEHDVTLLDLRDIAFRQLMLGELYSRDAQWNDAKITLQGAVDAWRGIRAERDLLSIEQREFLVCLDRLARAQFETKDCEGGTRTIGIAQEVVPIPTEVRARYIEKVCHQPGGSTAAPE